MPPPTCSWPRSSVSLRAYDEATRTTSWNFTNDLGGGNVGLAAGSSVELLASVRFPAGSTPDGTIATNTASLRCDPATSTPRPSSRTRPGQCDRDVRVQTRSSRCAAASPTSASLSPTTSSSARPTGGLDIAAGATLRDTLPGRGGVRQRDERWRRDRARLGHRRVDTSCRRRRRRLSHRRQRDRGVPGGDVQRRRQSVTNSHRSSTRSRWQRPVFRTLDRRYAHAPARRAHRRRWSRQVRRIVDHARPGVRLHADDRQRRVPPDHRTPC